MADGVQHPESNKTQNALLHELQKPEKLSKIVGEDQLDCLSCRLTGAAAFFGLGGYVYWSGRRALQQRGPEIVKKAGSLGLKGRIAALTALSSSLIGIGVVRLLN